jgi:siderophore synthetase component
MVTMRPVSDALGMGSRRVALIQLKMVLLAAMATASVRTVSSVKLK